MILNLRSQSTYNSQRNTIFRANFLVWYSRAAVTKIRAFQPFRKYFTANKQCHTRVSKYTVNGVPSAFSSPPLCKRVTMPAVSIYRCAHLNFPNLSCWKTFFTIRSTNLHVGIVPRFRNLIPVMVSRTKENGNVSIPIFVQSTKKHSVLFTDVKNRKLYTQRQMAFTHC
ncbi:uncharacterized protein LOC143152299 isoform X1 [Ptiloglossa arizonensis]|uniref:uncharacterized protein LOC143152299 isoform X1 n=1 Tax=Ptiloglossa arizonensis TaxID=3350558 RepID=UPI003FA0CB0D